MQMNDSYLFDAGWLFFAAWSVVVAFVSLTAFRSDLFPSRTSLATRPSGAIPETDPTENRPKECRLWPAALGSRYSLNLCAPCGSAPETLHPAC